MVEYKINSCKYDIKKFIYKIINEEFHIDYWDEWLNNQNYSALQILPNILVSCESENELIGICSIKVISNTECYLNSFYVKDNYRNRGIGSKLYSICEEYAINNGYKIIRLKVDPNFKEAISFYKKKSYIFDGYEEITKELNYYKNL